MDGCTLCSSIKSEALHRLLLEEGGFHVFKSGPLCPYTAAAIVVVLIVVVLLNN